jgi:hypothetical protein
MMRGVEMAQVRTLFDGCKHVKVIDVDVDPDTEIPAQVRGLGLCPDCMEEENVVPVSGVAPKPGGKQVVLDSILMMPI